MTDAVGIYARVGLWGEGWAIREGDGAEARGGVDWGWRGLWGEYWGMGGGVMDLLLLTVHGCGCGCVGGYEREESILRSERLGGKARWMRPG